MAPHRPIALGIALQLGLAGAASAQSVASRSQASDADPAPASVLARPAHLDLAEPTELTDAVEALSRTSKVPIAFSPSLLAEEPRRVRCACGGLTVRQALDRLLASTGFRYEEMNDQVIIFGFPGSKPGPVRPTRLAIPLGRLATRDLALVPLAATLDTLVTGTVLEASSLRPLAGAQVLAVGTGQGTVTDAEGRFRLVGLPTGTVTVRVERIGYRAVERTIAAGETGLRILMETSPVVLDALVITGTPGAAQLRSMGNAVGQLDAEEVLDVAPVQTVGDLISGRSAGVVVTPPTGMAGAGGRINIRGRTSISVNSDPLIYIDGVRVANDPTTGPSGYDMQPISRLGDINPEDIERIEIIKGPAASTLYGTEASNGVVQIITKRGQEDGSTLRLRIRQGVQSFENAAERIGANWGVDPQTGEITSLNVVAREEAAGRDMWTPGHMQGYGASLRGGAGDVRYYLGLDYDRDRGVEPTNELERLSGRANLAVPLDDALEVNANVGLVKSRIDLAPDRNASLLPSVVFALPAFLGTEKRGFFIGPQEAMWDVYDNVFQTIGRVTTGLQFDHRPWDWLTQRLTLGFDLTSEGNQFIIERMPEEYVAFFGPQLAKGLKNIAFRDVTYTTVDYAGTARAELSAGLVSSTSIGLQYYRNFTEFTAAQGEDFPTPNLTTTEAASVTFGSDDFVENATVGVFLQQQFSWHNRLFLTAALRADDNSAFGEDFDLVYYPKLSASWVVNEEPFWNVPFVSALRLRAAYGESGQQPQTFAALRTYQPITGSGDLPAVSPQFVGNPELAPERGQEFEVGLEAGLFDDRIGVNVTYYRQTTQDAILLRDVAPSLGFPGQQFVNAGSVRNEGIELGLEGLAVDTRDVDVNLRFNVATNHNEILDLGDIGTIFNDFTRHQEGFPIGSYFGRKVVSAERGPDGTATNPMCASDLDGGGAPVPCGEAPDVFLGRPTPAVEGAFTTTVTLFDRLRLYGMVDFKTDFYKWDVTRWGRCAVFRACEINFFPERFDPVEVATIQVSGGDIDAYVNDGSFAKLREVSASLTLPDQWAAAIGARRASISLAGRNLHTWTGWNGLDPENVATHTPDAATDQAQLPQLLQFVATLDLTF